MIWGTGAVGGTIGAYWARAGVDVLLVDAETPAIRRLVRLVHDVETGGRSQSMETFHELLAVCN